MTTNRVDGAMSVHGDSGTVVVSSVFATTPDDLWQAVLQSNGFADGSVSSPLRRGRRGHSMLR